MRRRKKMIDWFKGMKVWVTIGRKVYPAHWKAQCHYLAAGGRP